MKRYFTLLILAILVMSCNTARYISNGDAMMTQKNYEQAAREYAKARRNSPNNTKALVGLQNASDQYIIKQIEVFDNLNTKGEYVKASETMESTQSFVEEYSKYGIKIEIPESGKRRQQEIQNATAEFYYRHGLLELTKKDFRKAIEHFKKVQETVPNYKNTRNLLGQAEDAVRIQNAEKYYQSGSRHFQAGDYRKAYADFANATSQVKDFKNAAHLQQTALDRGKIRIALIPFTNNSRFFDLHRTMESYVVNNIMSANDPFIQIVDRQNIDRVLNELNFSYSSSVNPATISRAGKLLGVNYFITGQIVNVIVENPQPQTKTRDAYEFDLIFADGTMKITSHAARYNTHEQYIKITQRVEYQIISVETGSFGLSNIISESASDHIHYATYNGNYQKLVSYDPKLVEVQADIAAVIAAGVTYYLQNALNKIDYNLFTAKNTLKSPDELNDEITRAIAQKIANDILKSI